MLLKLSEDSLQNCSNLIYFFMYYIYLQIFCCFSSDFNLNPYFNLNPNFDLDFNLDFNFEFNFNLIPNFNFDLNYDFNFNSNFALNSDFDPDSSLGLSPGFNPSLDPNSDLIILCTQLRHIQQNVLFDIYSYFCLRYY